MISVVQMHVAVFGSSRVGKTCTIKALCGLPFEPTLAGTVNETYVYEGVLPQLKGSNPSVSTTVVKARFYSCEAFERDPVLLDQVTSETHAVLILYDVTNMESYKSATAEVYPSLRRRYPDAFFVLVGSKNDSTQRQVNIKQVEGFVSREGIYFMELSAKTGTNVKLLLSILRIRAMHSSSARGESQAAVSVETYNKLSPAAELDPILDQNQTLRSSFKTRDDPVLQAKIDLGSPGNGRFDPHSPHLTINSILGRISPVEETPRCTPPKGRRGRDNSSFHGQPSRAQVSLDDSSSLEFEWHTSSPISAQDKRKNSYSSYKSFMSEPARRRRPSGSYLNPTLSWNQKTSALQAPTRGIDNTKSHPKMRSTAFSHWPSEGGPENDEPKGYTPSTVQKNSKSSTSAPQLYVDVHAGNAKVGTIAIREGDNAYHLAAEFCRKNHLAASYTKKLAETLSQRVAQFYASETRYMHDQIKVNNAAQSEAGGCRQSRTRRGSSSASPGQHPRRLSLKERPLLGKLHVKVSRGKVAKLSVREGDDPKQVAQSFGRTYGLHKMQVNQIEQRVENHIREAQRKTDFEEPIQAPRRTPPKVPTERKILFKLEVDVGQGNVETIVVKEGDRPEVLAVSFVEEHHLDPSKVNRVTALIEQGLQSVD